MTVEKYSDPTRIPDSAFFILLKEGPKIWTNVPQESSEKYTGWFRTVRGGILTGSFGIETNISLAIEYLFFSEDPANEFDAVIRSLFKTRLLSPMTFDRKVSLFLELPLPWSDETRIETRNKLGQFRPIRNAMAHNPVWFEMTQEKVNVKADIKPVIMIGKNAVHVSDRKITEWNDLTRRLIGLTGAACPDHAPRMPNRGFEPAD